MKRSEMVRLLQSAMLETDEATSLLQFLENKGMMHPYGWDPEEGRELHDYESIRIVDPKEPKLPKQKGVKRLRDRYKARKQKKTLTKR